MPSSIPHYMLPTISSQTSARAATRAVVAAPSAKVIKQVSRPAKAAPRPLPSALPRKSAATQTTFSARQRAVVAPKPTVVTAASRIPIATAPRRTVAPVASTIPRPTVAAAPRPSTRSAADRHRLYQLVPAIEEEFARAREVYCGEIRRTCEHKVLHGSFSFDSSVLTEVQVAEPFRED
jgi:hypothetical protein